MTDLERGLRAAELQDALNAQRAKIRNELKAKLENVILYVDREEVARDKAVRLLREALAFLETV